METYVGYIKTPQDALIIFEACRRGLLNRVQRRLSTKERIHIRSGSIFAWDEREAGMRRWTDGRTWSPSRVLGSFLTYRELDTKRKPRRSVSGSSTVVTSKAAAACSYKPDGLIKQSFSICTATNQKLHLISYYSKADILAGRLKQPSSDPMFNHIIVPKGLYPELNPLDTSGGHSATINSLMRLSSSLSPPPPPQQTYNCPSPPPSLSSSPTSSDEDPMDLMAPPQPSPPSPPVAAAAAAAAKSSSIPTSLPPLYPLNRINSASCVNLSTSSSLLPVQDIALERIPSSEDQRQLRALYERLRL